MLPEKKLLVSLIIPCRNEEKFITRCLDSIIDNTFPNDSMEVLVVDGMSEDGTKEIVRDYASKHPFIKLVDNPLKIVPAALNIGIKNSSGEIIIRMDAHNIYENDYISKCVKYLQEYGADNVGGIWITLPGSGSVTSKSIALAVAHPFGAGNAYYRIGLKEPRYVDTVPFGCYRREVFDRIGLFDEELIRNQDDEFNVRLIKNGGKILLFPDIISYYHARTSLGKLWRMNFQYGYFKPLVAQKTGMLLTYRQLIPAFFVMSLAASAILSFLVAPFLYVFFLIVAAYVILNLGFSLSIARKNGPRSFFLLPLAFATLHFSYGLGYLKGLWDFLIVKINRNQKKIHDMPLTR